MTALQNEGACPLDLHQVLNSFPLPLCLCVRKSSQRNTRSVKMGETQGRAQDGEVTIRE